MYNCSYYTCNCSLSFTCSKPGHRSYYHWKLAELVVNNLACVIVDSVMSLMAFFRQGVSPRLFWQFQFVVGIFTMFSMLAAMWICNSVSSMLVWMRGMMFGFLRLAMAVFRRRLGMSLALMLMLFIVLVTLCYSGFYAAKSASMHLRFIYVGRGSCCMT